MTLNTYDVTKHHIGLKVAGGATNYGFTIAGSYNKELQREGGGAPDFGGSNDLIGQTPGLSRVTQDDFVGGMFQYNWGKDDAMFADCTNFTSAPQSRSLMSVPPMILKSAYDPDGTDDFVSDTVKNMFMVAGFIFVVFGNGIARHSIDADTWLFRGSEASTGFLQTDGTEKIVNAHYDAELGQIIVAVNDTTAASNGGNIIRLTTALAKPTYWSFDGPVTPNLTCRGFALKDSTFVMQVGQNLWSGVVPANFDVVSSVITWTKIGRLPGRWMDAAVYNGMLYILMNESISSLSFSTRIVAFDGSNILPIVSMPFNIEGRCITEYAGRIFIGGTGTDSNGGEHYGELYELTGASVRLVRSFSSETRANQWGGAAGEWPQSIDDLCVFEGMLWFGQKGKRMVAYDVTSDGLFGASEIQSNSDLQFTKIVAGRGRIWAWGYDATSDAAHGIYRIAQPADTVEAWSATMVTSDFIYEPGMLKRWSEIGVVTRYDGLTSIEYSTDSGATYTSLGLTETVEGAVYLTKAQLQAITPSHHIRFRIKIKTVARTGILNAMTYHRELVAITFSFAILDNGKRAWSFVINGAVEVERRDALLDEGLTQTQDMTDMASTIWGWATNRSALTFTDVDGSTANVQLIGLKEHMPLIGPNIDSEARPEALYQVQLIEV